MTIARDGTLPGEEAPEAMPDWLVQWPMIAFTGWWDAAFFDAWQPRRCPNHAECHDLAVPDPIERDGEHGLFA